MRQWIVLLVLSFSANGFAQQLPKTYLQLPIIRQATNYSCGPAALLSILTYWGVSDESESELYEALGTTEDHGTHPKKIVEVAQKYKLTARMQENTTFLELKQALKEGATIILDIQAWREDPKVPWHQVWDDGHYVNLIALDNQFVYLMDPSTASGYTYIPIGEFFERWHDYEIENGKRRNYHRMMIYIKGLNSLPKYPQKLTRLN
jgi:predicted double-glycine peptidase